MLTPEQKNAVAGWVAAGDNLAEIQKKLSAQFNLTLTYMDVRFLVDDLDLALKDPEPPAAPAQPDLSQSAPPPPPAEPAPPAPADPFIEDEDDDIPQNVPEEATAAANVRVELDNVTVIPNAVASGSVTFSDGVTGKWFIDSQGYPGFTQISQPGYRPTQADAQAFMQELNAALQKRGY